MVGKNTLVSFKTAIDVALVTRNSEIEQVQDESESHHNNKRKNLATDEDEHNEASNKPKKTKIAETEDAMEDVDFSYIEQEDINIIKPDSHTFNDSDFE